MSALTLTCSKLIFMVDYLKQSEFVYALLPIYCFCTVTGGTDGLFAQKTLEISDEVLSSYKNQGGYDLLGRTRDQIRTTEQVNAAMTACQALKLDALVIIGGSIPYANMLNFTYLIHLNDLTISFSFLKVLHPTRMLLSLLRLLLSQSVQQRLADIWYFVYIS